jgi:neurotransmitter:Na+ symporter, NSS family
MLATMGATIGISNLTRFPYLCKQYGGVYFFLPYLTLMVFFGFPLLLLELALG